MNNYISQRVLVSCILLVSVTLLSIDWNSSSSGVLVMATHGQNCTGDCCNDIYHTRPWATFFDCDLAEPNYPQEDWYTDLYAWRTVDLRYTSSLRYKQKKKNYIYEFVTQQLQKRGE
ncbi:hypothetical protein SAMD00019534_012090 [Acytostelium subglobosum LB1]|uniref:hypothetical protein n=1 Tax=Acytostelium subglobosum LB1 TaxID=1410327 RepID=UPI000644CB07|nr:hypothetical protein SAMD00019534_012090 [Acytostelium subglobosum LB1]GAM18034.1 hypothetical protein SAMD00019534_012090 [Acytostelium subglobosum LB1]|eukprot:XP_012758630.1 hypothetical protein SAMD00019534_012090 [Acytostelium subglobosum LB1]